MLEALGMNCTRDRKREGEKWNSQLGGRNRKKNGKNLANCIVFCNRNRTKRVLDQR